MAVNRKRGWSSADLAFLKDRVFALEESLGLHGSRREEGGSVLSEPTPIYGVGLQEIMELENRFLERTAPIGWRYLLLAGQLEGPSTIPATKPCTVDVVEGSDGRPQPVRFNQGWFAEGHAVAIAAAHRVVSTENEGYEIRILEIPALASSAVWLHSPSQDRFFPILTEARPANPIEEDMAFVERTVVAARNKPPALEES